ncbi:unnamed protein product [Microthlaspi erraticum]|uniref:Uncharacterized protein n=1 Tax=Microthlaspi erraticum TaxID=1685480 RepID=A0A6D2HJW0_9BRAS|nr:unnamed protein product [Microthlaspi erraticum]
MRASTRLLWKLSVIVLLLLTVVSEAHVDPELDLASTGQNKAHDEVIDVTENTAKREAAEIKPPQQGKRQARGCGARGRGAEAVVAELEAVESVSVASEASVDASVGLGAGAAPGWGGAPAQGLDDLVVGLLTQLLARFPPVVPQGAPGVPPVAEVQQRAAGFVQPQAVGLMVPSYLDMMGHMQRIGTPYFEGGVSPEAADEWRQRLERNFQSIRCLV